MSKIVSMLVLVLAIPLGGCPDGISHGSNYSHMGGLFAPVLRGGWFDPESSVHKPAECIETARKEIWTEPYYGSYGTYFGEIARYSLDYQKKCGSVWIAH